MLNPVNSVLKLYPDSNHFPALAQATLLIETTIIFCFGYNDSHSNGICAANMADRVILLKNKSEHTHYLLKVAGRSIA